MRSTVLLASSVLVLSFICSVVSLNSTTTTSASNDSTVALPTTQAQTTQEAFTSTVQPQTTHDPKANHLPFDEKLYSDLMGSYVASARPVSDPTKPVDVNVDTIIYMLFDVEEKLQLLKMVMWIRLSWIDANLKWNPSEYGGIEKTSIQSSELWRPDITLYNAGIDDASSFDVTLDTLAIVKSNGHVQWNFPSRIISACPIDITYFPFDEQNCEMEFGSWVYDQSGIDLHVVTEDIDLGLLNTNVEFDVRKYTARKKVTSYSIGDYPTVIYKLTFRRRSLYYLFNLVCPVALITAIGMLTFCLPPDAGEKVSLCVTMVISMALILLLIAESLPATSLTIPLIGEFFAAIVVMLALSTLMTVLVLLVHHKGGEGKKVPRCVRVVILKGLARLLCFHIACKDDSKEAKKSKEFAKFNKAMEMKDLENNLFKNNQSDKKVHGDNNEEKTLNPTKGLSTDNLNPTLADRRVHLFDNPVLHQTLGKISDIHELVATHVKDAEHQGEIEADWRHVAMVIDRLFLVLSFGITFIAGLCLLLVRPEYTA